MKLATVGTSWITTKFIEAAKLSGKLTLEAVYSRNEANAMQFAEAHQAPSYFTDLEALAASSSIEIVYIASPNSLHYEQAILLLKNKKHVICEKPIFSNVKEWEHAHEVANQYKVFLFEAIRTIHDPNFQSVQQSLNKVGKIRSAVFQFLQYSSRYNAVLSGEEPNVFSPAFSGGAYVDIGVYPLYVAIALFGEPKDASLNAILLPTGVDGSGTLTLTYDDFICTILYSKITHSSAPSEIHGEQATITINKLSEMSSPSLFNHQTKETVDLSVSQAENDMQYEARTFVEIIESNDVNSYKKLTNLSKIVLSILETTRKQHNILFSSDV